VVKRPTHLPTAPRDRPLEKGGSYRGPGAPVRQDRLAVVRIRFEINQELPLSTLTRAHPELQASILASQPIRDGRTVLEIELTSSEPKDYASELSDLPGVLALSRLSPPGPVARYQIVIDLSPQYMRAVERVGALLRYPRLVHDGQHTVEVAARTSEIRRLLEDLRRICRDVEVLRFGRIPMSSCPSTLTPRQYALLNRALAAGYFDVPRRITLTRLAHTLGRGKSSVSRALALIEKQLAESSVAAAS
jgi:predicted DNA binding protein